MKKKLAALTAVIMLVSVFTGCGSAESTAVATEAAASSASTIVSGETTADFFDEDYDPLTKDYNPYGDSADVATAANGQGAETAVGDEENTPETEKTAETAVAAASEQKPHNTAAAETEKSSPGNSAGVVLELKESNSWESGSDRFMQIDGSVKNGGSKTVSGWTAVISVGAGASVEQSWNCNLSISGGKITAAPVDFNSEIAPGGEGTFGMILKNAGSFDASKSTLDCGTVAAVGGSSDNNGNQTTPTQNGSVGNNAPAVAQAKNVPAPSTDDWLSVKGCKIVDKSGKEVWLTGVNWFGYNTGTNTFDGLWSCDLNSSLSAIADRGFNLLRVPISSQLIKQWSNGDYPTANFNQATNSYLVGMNSLEIFDYVVGQCRANGIKIMIDIHCAETDSMGHMKNMWYGGSVTEKDYLDSLKWIAARYKNDDTVIAYDLENEPHGKANEAPRAKWDASSDSDNWRCIAEKAANSVLSANPNVLVMVEGIEIYPMDIKKNGSFSSTNMGDYYCTWWGGNLRGVKDNPVDLGKYQNKLVYSPHDYGPAVYQQPWFQGGYSFDSLYKDCWYDNWFYIQKQNIAPLLIGEWGGFMTEPNVTWMKYLRQLIKENKINHTFWCFNSNSGDTGGLVKDDFTSWDEEKYGFVKEVLWQKNGKFVGLDHKIPLGSNGITLSEAK